MLLTIPLGCATFKFCRGGSRVSQFSEPEKSLDFSLPSFLGSVKSSFLLFDLALSLDFRLMIVEIDVLGPLLRLDYPSYALLDIFYK